MSLRISTQSHSDGHLHSLAVALAGASVAAVGMMFVPVSVLEGLTGSTGLAELVPAAGAPLGDTARALMAFGTGAVTLAALLTLLLRPDTQGIDIAATAPTPEESERPALAVMRTAIWAKMPWNKGDDDIRELADLPKLRNGDAHPDAPARRPLSASQDLPSLELSQPERASEVEPTRPNDVQPNSAAERSLIPAYGQASIAEMVAQLEAAFAQRQVKLAELEAVAAHIASERSLPLADAAPEATAPVSPSFIPDIRDRPFVGRPVLESLPPLPRPEDGVDSALAAALATLQRMTTGGR